VNIEVNY